MGDRNEMKVRLLVAAVVLRLLLLLLQALLPRLLGVAAAYDASGALWLSECSPWLAG